MAASVEGQSLQVEHLFFILQLLVVMDRIRSFPLSSPLSKFLNGLEILLAKAQVREELREGIIFSNVCLPGFGEENLLHAVNLRSRIVIQSSV